MKIKYNGKRYIKRRDDLTDSIILSAKEHLKKELKPFDKDIALYKGLVSVNIPKYFGEVSIEISNIPDDLKNKINASLSNSFVLT